MAEKMRLVEREIEPGAEKPMDKPIAEGYKKAKRLANETGQSLQTGINAFTNVLTSPEAKVAGGVVGAGVAALIAASLIGVGELAVAGAAGYLAYRALTHKSE